MSRNLLRLADGGFIDTQLLVGEDTAAGYPGTGTKLGGMMDEKLSEVVAAPCASVVV